MVEVAKELRGVAGERPIAGEEFAEHHAHPDARPARAASRRWPRSRAAAIHIVNYGYPDDYFATYATNVRALDETGLADGRAQFIRPDEVVWIVVGDLAQGRGGNPRAESRRGRPAGRDGKSTN